MSCLELAVSKPVRVGPPPSRLTIHPRSDESLDALKLGCFKYFERGGDCVAGPVGLLSGQVTPPSNRSSIVLIQIPRVSPSFFTLFRHFLAVAFYSIWVLFTHPRPVPGRVDINGKPLSAVPSIDEYPALFIMSIRTASYSRSFRLLIQWLTHCVQIWAASLVFFPLVWTECSW